MVLVLGLRSEREVRGSKIRDGEGQGWAGGMVRRNLGRERKVFRDADARCTASTAAPADIIESVVGHLVMHLVVERRRDVTRRLGPKLRYQLRLRLRPRLRL